MDAKLLLLALGLAGAALAQSLEIRPAVELVYPTAANRGFQVESSTDLLQWSPFGQPVFGNQGTLHTFAPAAASGQFFRVAQYNVSDLNAQLETIRAANKVPALACAVILSNRIVGLGAVGLRKAGVTDAPVTINDSWHHGSLTKGMTATLAAMMVEEERLRWNSTLAEIFPDLAPAMNAAWRTVTLEQLCTHRSGAPGDLGPSGIWNQLWAYGGTPRSARRFLLQKVTALAPNATPGTRYEYSNAGYAIAGHMIETILNRPWEDVITDRLFTPLGMTSAGFGVPATPRHINQPWGHQWVNNQPSPVEPGTNADNPPGIGPAGTVHCSVIDLAKYAALHLAGHRANTPLLTQASFFKLHTPVPNNADYAMGWAGVDRSWAKGMAYTHAGSNLQWFSVIWLAPQREFGVVAICNLATGSGTNPGANATDQVAGAMINRFLPN